VDAEPPKLWGKQYPFERNYLQRTMTLVALGGVFAVTVILLVHADVTSTVGITLICAGVMSALAAVSRHQYVRETRLGFVILNTRGGSLVLGSSLAFAIVGVLVALLVILR
jgi:uncharacterized membrane protein HdeD (DUF308 family)